MSRVWGVLLMTLTAWVGPATAQKSCLGEVMALQTLETIDPKSPKGFRHALKSERSGRRFETKVFLSGVVEARELSTLKIRIGFDEKFGGVSLPYNLAAVMLVREGEVIGWWDYTNSCAEPPLSFFPGREIEIAPVKLIGDRPQKLQIMVWGSL